MDDKSCYPTAWRAMRGTGGPMTTAYLEHKEEILKVFGGHLWPDASEAERRERMKGAMSALDNNGGLDAWRKKNPSAKSLRGVKHALPNGVTFTCHAYKEEQTAGTRRKPWRSRSGRFSTWTGSVGLMGPQDQTRKHRTEAAKHVEIVCPSGG